MGKTVLIAVGVFVLAGMYFLFNSGQHLKEADTILALREHEILARNAAIAGKDRVKQMLSDDFRSYSNVAGSNDGVDYSVDASVSGSNVVVQSTATSNTAGGDAVDFNVQVTYRRVTIIPPKAPPFMRYAAISDHDMVLNGDIEGGVYADGDPENELNANMHTNGRLEVKGIAANVQGFGTFGDIAKPSEETLSEVFVPNYNPSGADPVYQTDPVDIPEMDPAALAAAADVDSTTAGDVVLSGDYNFGGTRENPYIWHIEGNLSIKPGGTKIDGYVMFLVDGKTEIKGNVQVGSVDHDGGDESSIALYTKGDVVMSGNAEVWAQIYTNGNSTFDAGTTTLYGSITSKGKINFKGTVNIYYREASPALTRGLQPDLVQLVQMSYSEW